ATALYKRVESGGWTSNCNQEVQNFVQTFERVKKLVPIEDKVRLERLQSFGQGRDLEQRTAIIGILLKLRVYLEGNEVENSDNPDEKIA
ncbi:11066_t:CDS:2, partial [Entrophospora sp. SA101]